MNTDTCFIELTQGKVAVVDAIDYDFLMQWHWCAIKDHTSHGYRWYAVRRERKKTIRMHRVVAQRAGLPYCKQYDHADHDGLCNTRENIRPCRHAQNLANQIKQSGCTSRYKGVHWDKNKKRWKAQITVSMKTMFLGYFHDEEDARQAYADAALKYWGEFACF